MWVRFEGAREYHHSKHFRAFLCVCMYVHLPSVRVQGPAGKTHGYYISIISKTSSFAAGPCTTYSHSRLHSCCSIRDNVRHNVSQFPRLQAGHRQESITFLHFRAFACQNRTKLPVHQAYTAPGNIRIRMKKSSPNYLAS
jgi:hypothetical protein